MRFGEDIKLGLKTATRWGLSSREDAPSSAACSRILTYHSAGDRDHEMNVSTQSFRRQMEWLSDTGMAISLEDAAEGKVGIAVTFDDGYRDNLTEAAPILDELSLRATVFVVGGRAGMRLAHDMSRAGGELMSWEEIREIESMGWEIGAHSLTHRRLADLSATDQAHEIEGCTRMIEDALCHSVDTFAYPYGSSLDYNETSKELVRACGYTRAVSNRYGPNLPGCDRWALRRMTIDRSDTLESFAAKASGSLDRLAWLDSSLGIRARRAMNGLLKTA